MTLVVRPLLVRFNSYTDIYSRALVLDQILPSCNGKISSNGPKICFNSESERMFNVFIPFR